MMEYGLRLCEAQAIQKDCITGDEVIIRRSLVEHKLRETTKTGRKGVWRFKLTPVAREALKNVRLSTSPYVFVKETGYPYSNKDLNRIWHEAEEKTGINVNSTMQ